MAGSESMVSPSHYITHHLQHFANKKQLAIIDFSVIHFDTIFWSVTIGLVMCVILYFSARQATSNVPSRFQCFIEMLVEWIDEEVKRMIPGDTTFVSSVVLTIFVWIFLMNCLDLLPVDLFAKIFDIFYLSKIVSCHRLVPTADLNCPLGISTAILILTMWYKLKIKGPLGFIRELISSPFGTFPLLWLPNLFFNLIEYLAKTVSLAVRLFGNMYAGELLFLLIALLGSSWNFSFNLYFLGFLGQIFVGSAWAIFHILVVFLQAFIFMMLTLVYIGQVYEKH